MKNPARQGYRRNASRLQKSSIAYLSRGTARYVRDFPDGASVRIRVAGADKKSGDPRVAAQISDADRGRRRSVRCADCSATWENTTVGEGEIDRTSIRHDPARDQKRSLPRRRQLTLGRVPDVRGRRCNRTPGLRGKPDFRLWPGPGIHRNHPAAARGCATGQGGLPISGCHRVLRFEGRSGGVGIRPLTAFGNRGTGNQEHEPGAKKPGGKGTSIHDNLQSSHLQRKSPAAMRMTELYGFCGATFRCLLA